MSTFLVSALVAISVATASAVVADRINRRSDRRDREDAHLEVVAVDFVRNADTFGSLTLGLRLLRKTKPRRLGAPVGKADRTRFCAIDRFESSPTRVFASCPLECTW
jgi:hypothetical protein